MARTPPIVDDAGRPVAGSIATLERVRLDGVEQTIVVRGRSAAAPVLLFLAGGPGVSELGLWRHYQRALEDHFVVVQWEQPGSGKSFRVPGRRRTLTTERYLGDLLELVAQLRARFGRRLYLVGHSWGSVLGTLAAAADPRSFHAYVGVGQVVTIGSNDRLVWERTVAEARRRGHHRVAARLERTGPPPYVGRRSTRRYLALFGLAARLDPIGDAEHERSFLRRSLWIPEYTMRDRLNWVRGVRLGMRVVYPHLTDLDLGAAVRRLELPVYLVEGRHDHDALPELAEAWLDRLDAPTKALVWFEGSGHSPCYEEPARFTRLLVERVLPETGGRP